MTPPLVEGAANSFGSRELAKLTGVRTDTLRHYERKGLIPTPPRTPAGYRRYPNQAVARLVSKGELLNN